MTSSRPTTANTLFAAWIPTPGQTDDDIEAEGEKDVKNGEIENAHPGLTSQRSNERQCNQERGSQTDAWHRAEKLTHFHARSPVFSPNSPEGLNMRTTISTTKAKIS